jgi:hypothetical protein
LSGTNYIGVNNDAATQFFPGSIDRVGVLSGAKTAAEINADYDNDVTGGIAAPSDLTGGAGTNSVFLVWTDNSSNETGFNVERSTDGTSWTPIASTSANITSFIDTGLSSSTLYYHRVRAFNSTTYSGYSNVDMTTTTPSGGQKLALWNMNGTAGTVAKETDDGPSGLTLTENGSPTSATGTTSPQTDGAYSLNGTSQYLSSADTGLPTGNSPYTVEAWVDVPSFSGGDGNDFNVVAWGTRSNYESVQFAVEGNLSGNPGQITWGDFGENHGSGGAIQSGVWQFIAATYDGSQVCLYINGAQDSCHSVTNTPNLTLSGTNYIGVNNDAATQFFPGSLDRVQVLDGARTPGEILADYNNL